MRIQSRSRVDVVGLSNSSVEPTAARQAKRQALAADPVTRMARLLRDDGPPSSAVGAFGASLSALPSAITDALKAGTESAGGRFGTADGLFHAAVPFRARPVFLRLAKSRSQLMDYAAGGFHVSVTRGTAGGCKDPSSGFSQSGTIKGTCDTPINSPEIRAMWASAAALYKIAFENGVAGEKDDPARDISKDQLRSANAAADAAYRAEGVTPPRDPQTGTSEAPVDPAGTLPAPPKGMSTGAKVAIGIGVAMLGLFVARQVQGDDELG